MKGTNSDYYVSWKGPDIISVVHHMYMIAGDAVLSDSVTHPEQTERIQGSQM